MLGRSMFLVCALAAFPAMAQQHSQKPEPAPGSAMQRQAAQLNRQAQHNARAMAFGDRQAWLDSLGNQTRLRDRLAEAWQHMGLPPEQARKVADAYDPEMATQMYHTPMRGKSDEQVASLLQSAVRSGRYQVANQLLIDYQRAKLSLSEMANADPDHIVSGR